MGKRLESPAVYIIYPNLCIDLGCLLAPQLWFNNDNFVSLPSGLFAPFPQGPVCKTWSTAFTLYHRYLLS